VLERLPSLASDGAPNLPFYRSRDMRERKKEKKKEKIRGRREPWSHVALLP
jgi:hypothetical protein